MKIKLVTRGFTVIETLTVVVMIGILVSVTTFGMLGWRSRAAVAEVKHNLNGVRIAMDNYKNFNNTYPLSLPSNFSVSGNVTIVVKSATSTSYCVEGSSTSVGGLLYRVGTSYPEPVAGAC